MQGISKTSGHLKLGKTRKRKVLDMELKMKVIGKFESGQRLASIARDFDLASSTVKTILQDSERIKEHVKNSTSLKSTVITKKRGGPALEMEKLLIAWIQERLRNDEPISLPTIKTKARSLFEEQKVMFGDTESKFVASNGWFHRFRVRSNIPDLKFGIDLTYTEHLKEILSEGEYTAQQVYNVSEIEMVWKSIPGSRGFAVAELEDKITLLIGANANGDHKLKPLFVYPSNLTTFPNFYLSNAADMTIAVFEKWFYDCFIPDVENYCEENCIPIKILLIVNDTPWHSIRVNDFHPNVKILLLPRRIFVIQPMNQGIISTVRACYLRRTLAEAAEGKHSAQAFSEFLESYTINEAVRNMVEAWNEISNVCWNASWKRLCPYFANKEYSMSKNGENVTRDILELAELLQIPANAGDVADFLKEQGSTRSSETLSIKQSDDYSVVEGIFNAKEMAIAFHEISSALERFKKMDPDSSRFFKVQEGVETTFKCYKTIYESIKCGEKQLAEVDYNLPSTSSDSMDKWIVPVDPDELMNVSTSSES